MEKKRLFSAAVLVAFCAIFAASALAEVKDFARLVPKETVLYFGMENDTAKIGAYQKSPAYKFGQDKRVRAIIDEIYKTCDEMIAKAAPQFKDLGVSLRDLESLENGGFAVAFGVELRQVPDAPGPMPSPQFVMLFDLNSAGASKCWGKINAIMGKLVAKGILTVSTKTIDGVSTMVYEIKPPGSDEDTPEDAPSVAPPIAGMLMPSICVKGKVGILAINPDSLRKTLGFINSSGKGSLAETELYKKTMAKVSSKKVVTAFVNIETIIGFSAVAPMPPEVKKILFETLGLGNIKSIGIGSWANEDGSFSDTFIYCPGLRSPLFQPFLKTTEKFSLVKGVSKYSPGFVAMTIDAPETYRTILKIAKDAAGEEKFNRAMKQLKEFETKNGVSIENDFLNSLGHEMLLSMPSLSVDVMCPAMVVAVEVKDRAKLERSISRVFDIIRGIASKETGIDLTLSKKIVGADTIHFHSIAGAYCFHGKYLIVGSTAERVEQFIDTLAGKNLSVENSAHHQKALKALGGKNSMFGYVNMGQYCRIFSGFMFFAEIGFNQQIQRKRMMRDMDWKAEPHPRFPRKEEAHSTNERDMLLKQMEMVKKMMENGQIDEKKGKATIERMEKRLADLEKRRKLDQPTEVPREDIEEMFKERKEGIDEELDDEDPVFAAGPDKDMLKILKLAGRLISIAPEYIQAYYFAISPDDDGLRIREYTP